MSRRNDTPVVVIGVFAGVLLAVAILLTLAALAELVRTVHG